MDAKSKYLFYPVTYQDRPQIFTVNIHSFKNLAICTALFNYAKPRVDILRFLFMSDQRILRCKQGRLNSELVLAGTIFSANQLLKKIGEKIFA